MDREKQWENFPEIFMTLLSSEFSRISNRKYNEVADEVRVAKGWKKTEVAEKARMLVAEMKVEWEVKDEQVYDWFEGGADPRSSFTKLMEMVLGINLPFQCYWNAGKR